MSDKTIRKGDLVIVSDPSSCCGNGSAIGRPFTVQNIEMHSGRCSYCSEPHSVIAALQPSGYWIAVHRLRKIDPPATGEYDGVSVRKPVEVTA